MFDNNIGEWHCGVFYRVNAPMIIFCLAISGAMLAWTSYVHADEFSSVPIGETAKLDIHADSQPLAVQNLDTSAAVDANDSESRTVDTDPDLSDVVQLAAGNGDQHSQLDLAGSRDMESLDVVDTGSSVKLPNASDDMGGGIDHQIDHQKVNVDVGGQSMVVSNDMIGEDGRPEAELNELIEQADQRVAAVARVNLPATSTFADAHSQAGDAGDQLEDASSDAVSEEGAGLPYAVVLALLALIGLVPVARRSDQPHV